MNKKLTLLFIAACITAVTAQSQKKGSNLILVRNLHTMKIVKIEEKSGISVLTGNQKQVSGHIRLIRADTIFFRDTLVRVSDIKKIYQLSKSSPAGQPENKESQLIYDSGSEQKEIICPPDWIYSSTFNYRTYMHNLIWTDTTLELDAQNPLVYKNFLKMNLAKLLHFELGFSYERRIDEKVTWETELSGMIGVDVGKAVITDIYGLYKFNGISVTTCPKFYFINPRTYFAAVFMYRYVWANKIHAAWPQGTAWNDLQDQIRNEYAISIRIGTQKRYHKTVLDWYFGLGIKYMQVQQQTYGSYNMPGSKEILWYNADHSPIVTSKGCFGPVLNAGLKIGRAF